MNEILALFLIFIGFLFVTFVGYRFLRKQEKESEAFVRNNAEEAMRIKARQYGNGNS